MTSASEPALRVGMVAGEASGDLLAAALLEGMRGRWPGLQAEGVGGRRMVAAGLKAWDRSDRLAVHGFVEALRVYAGLARWRRELAGRIAAWRPDVFVGIDAPDFNLGLEARVRRRGVRTVHFVSPSVWAWRGWRVRRIRRSTDLVLCLFPFEPELYRRSGVAAEYVGHPLADLIPEHPDRAAARRVLGLPEEGEVVALLPGSRAGEVHHLGPRFLQAAHLMLAARPGLRFVLPVAPGRRMALEAMARASGPDLPLHLVDEQSHAALAACDVTLIASGTATLEAALFKRAMVVAYAQHPASHWLMARLGYLPWVALPNILLREFAVPELLQDAATPQALAAATLAWLDDPAGRAALGERFTQLHVLLRRNTAQAATDAIASLVGR